MKTRIPSMLTFIYATALSSQMGFAADINLPTEITAHSHGAQVGPSSAAASHNPGTAVLNNPALMSSDTYNHFTGSYHRPAQGREFFQGSLVDSRTADYALGLLYRGFSDDYQPRVFQDIDSPVKHRIGLAISQKVSDKLALGANAQYVEGFKFASQEKYSGVLFGGGLYYDIGTSLRLGLSSQNHTDKKELHVFAPRTDSIGILYSHSKIDLSLDWQRRSRVDRYENPYLPGSGDLTTHKAVQKLITGAKWQARDNLSLSGFYSYGISAYTPESAGVGAHFAKKNYVISYSAVRGNIKETAVDHTLSLTMKLQSKKFQAKNNPIAGGSSYNKSW